MLILAPEILEQYAPGADLENLDLSAFRNAPFLSMADNLLFSGITQTFCLQAGFIPRLVVRTNDYATKLHQVAWAPPPFCRRSVSLCSPVTGRTCWSSAPEVPVHAAPSF